jgi:hypothetical protein
MATTVIWPMSKTNDEIIGKTWNEMRHVRTHTWAPGTSPKLKFLQDLSIRVNLKVSEEVVHHAGLWVDGGLYLRLHVWKVIHLSLESSDPFHHALSLVSPITDVPLQRSVPVRMPGRGRGSDSQARLGVTVRGVITTALMVTRVATPIPSVPLGLLRVSLDEAHHRVFPNRWSRGWWKALRPNQPSQVSSHRRHECKETLDGGGTHTSPSLRCYGWRCHRRLWP